MFRSPTLFVLFEFKVGDWLSSLCDETQVISHVTASKYMRIL